MYKKYSDLIIYIKYLFIIFIIYIILKLCEGNYFIKNNKICIFLIILVMNIIYITGMNIKRLF